MKVKQSEYKAFAEKMIQKGKDPETFTFFKKKETILNEMTFLKGSH